MKFSILIPHFRTLKMTSYAVAQFLKYKGNHEVEIIVIDNSWPDDSIKGLEPFGDQIQIFKNTSDKLSSHGVALDMGMEIANNNWIITAESDSFPTKDNWLDYYTRLINEGYDGAASLLNLSGGTYGHPAGALYKRSIWVEAWEYCRTIPYAYFPNMSQREGFACHLGVHYDIINEFLKEPEDYIELSDSYKPYTRQLAEQMRLHYSPVCNPFHHGLGNRQESIRTYGQRTVESEAATVFFDGKTKLINRIGAEPGQWFSWWHAAMCKKVFNIPTEVKWLPGKENQQQEYTLMENGFRHIWGISAYKDVDSNDEVAKIKQSLPEQLYESLPEHQKIKSI